MNYWTEFKTTHGESGESPVQARCCKFQKKSRSNYIHCRNFNDGKELQDETSQNTQPINE